MLLITRGVRISYDSGRSRREYDSHVWVALEISMPISVPINGSPRGRSPNKNSEPLKGTSGCPASPRAFKSFCTYVYIYIYMYDLLVSVVLAFKTP